MSSRREASDVRLRKHADYQRVYKASRKYFSAQISYFFVKADSGGQLPRPGTRVGLTVPKAVGKAVDRNRIKRRLRELIHKNYGLITSPTDVILHPKRFVLQMEFGLLEREVISIFRSIERRADPVAANRSHQGRHRKVPRREVPFGLR